MISMISLCVRPLSWVSSLIRPKKAAKVTLLEELVMKGMFSFTWTERKRL